ncbi:hypothetical protein [Stenotrophomonas maltophilia]|uniref:hypothetical protein n=1 Tax=Stenotrophomonas maltophilia TaxID=40324 RepID=UPI00404228A7
MKSKPAFDAARLSAKWARKALQEFDDAAREYFTRKGNARIFDELDKETGEVIIKIGLKQEPPDELSRKITEAMNNARHCFDQATYAACSIVSGGPFKSVNYPWAENPTDLVRRLEIKKIPKVLHKTFLDHHPYPNIAGTGQTDTLVRNLAKLANMKHSLGIEINADIAMVRTPSITSGDTRSLKILNPVWDASKREAAIIRYKAREFRLNGMPESHFNVCLKNFDAPPGVSALQALTIFVGRAERVIDTLEFASEVFSPPASA